MRISKPRTLAAVGICFMTIPGVFSAEIIVACSASPVSNLSLASPNATSAITCPQFNAALGTLNEFVLFNNVLSPTPNFSGSLTIFNQTATAFSGNVAVIEEWQLTTLAAVSTMKMGNTPYAPFNLAAGATGTFPFTFNLQSIILSATTQTLGLAALTGTGSVHAGDIAVTSRLDSAFALQITAYDLSAPVNASIVYRYTPGTPTPGVPTPEPSTWSLAAGGILAMLCVAKRKR